MWGIRGFFAAGLLLALAACATTPAPPPRPYPPRSPVPPPRPPPEPPRPAPPAPRVSWSTLPGWGGEDHLAALAAISAACRVKPSRIADACAALAQNPPSSDAEARGFVELWFALRAEPDEGLLTAYYTPTYEARRSPKPPFTAPLRPTPSDPGLLIAERSVIEAAPADDALLWMRPEDLFFLQIQGSAVLDLPGGERVKAGFAAANGQTFVGLARVMREQGLITDAGSSASAIHAWLAAHRGPEADAVMDMNPRYVFFRIRPDDGASPAGAAGVALPPGRAVAVDPAFHAMGELLWIEASDPRLTGARPAYSRLVAALDVGSAIKGEVRADLYVGLGDDAGDEAGHVRHRLTIYRLEPR